MEYSKEELAYREQLIGWIEDGLEELSDNQTPRLRIVK